jgi:hypothetical protein
MKRAFAFADGQVVSALLPIATPDIFKIGDRIGIIKPLYISPDIVIKVGEFGTVDYVNEATGWVEILLDAYHKALAGWDNHLWLEPFGTDDIIGGIMHCGSLLARSVA